MPNSAQEARPGGRAAMTPELSPDAYFERVEALAARGDYAEGLAFAERVGPALKEHLTREHVRRLRVRLKHAEMVLAATRSGVRAANARC